MGSQHHSKANAGKAMGMEKHLHWCFLIASLGSSEWDGLV